MKYFCKDKRCVPEQLTQVTQKSVSKCSIRHRHIQIKFSIRIHPVNIHLVIKAIHIRLYVQYTFYVMPCFSKPSSYHSNDTTPPTIWYVWYFDVYTYNIEGYYSKHIKSSANSYLDSMKRRDHYHISNSLGTTFVASTRSKKKKWLMFLFLKARKAIYLIVKRNGYN